MLFSTVLKSTALLLALALRANAHAMPNPALGVKGVPGRSDTQRPSTSKPCGKVNIADNIDNSTAVPAAADGTVILNITNSNPGADGSRSVSVQVDATGTGKNFVTATVTKNGDAAPSTDGTQPITLQLPAGTKCTGGKEGNLCLLSVKSTAGFGGCAVVSQLAASSSSSSSSGDASEAGSGTTTSAASAPSASSTKKPCKSKRRNGRAVGTRAARALRRGLHENPVFA